VGLRRFQDGEDQAALASQPKAVLLSQAGQPSPTANLSYEGHNVTEARGRFFSTFYNKFCTVSAPRLSSGKTIEHFEKTP